MFPQTESNSVGLSATATIPELQQSKTAVLNTLASKHSRRSYEFAIEKFIAWYCSEPRLTFNRSVVVRYRSFLERLSLSAATINLHLSAIRRLADESAESGWLSPELAIGIRRVKGVKRLGRKMGNWLTRNQAQELVNAASKTNLRGWRDGAMVGLLLGCGLRRSEVVGLNLDQLQSREGRWVIVNLTACQISGLLDLSRTVALPSNETFNRALSRSKLCQETRSALPSADQLMPIKPLHPFTTRSRVLARGGRTELDLVLARTIKDDRSLRPSHRDTNSNLSPAQTQKQRSTRTVKSSRELSHPTATLSRCK